MRAEPTAAVVTFQKELRAGLAQAGDPQRAEQARRYLKSQMPMYGVGVPQTRRLAVDLARRHPWLWEEAATWETTLRRLWDEAERREERLAVLAVVRARLGGEHVERVEALDLYRRFLCTGAWWDLVDETSHAVGAVLLAHPDEDERLRRWARDEDLWVRRSAIICQLQHKDRTDPGLLSDVIEANQEAPEFFIRKAIGWALRDYARTAPVWVRRFVDSHPRLSPLSRREALKHL